MADPSWAVMGPVKGEPPGAEIFALAVTISFLVASSTPGPNADCTKGLVPSWKPTR